MNWINAELKKQFFNWNKVESAWTITGIKDKYDEINKTSKISTDSSIMLKPQFTVF